MEKAPLNINNINTINPAYEKNREKLKFREKYKKREKMEFEYGEFEYIDISPEKQTGKDVFVATGTPWSWDLMEDFVFNLVQAGHRVMAIEHPDTGLKESVKYKPELQRPAAIKAFFEKKHINDAVVVAHSMGFMDITRKGSDNIGGIVALNPAGLNKNSPLAHSLRSLKNVELALSRKSGTEKESQYYKKMLKDFFHQSPSKSFKEIIDIGKADIKKELEDFKNIPVITFRNTDDTLVPIDKLLDNNYRKLKTGGNHLGPFIHEDQMQKVISAIKEIEETRPARNN